MTEQEFRRAFDKAYGNVEAARQAGRLDELEHAWNRDNDLSIKGGGLLGFSGLMLACDFVFLAAADNSFLAPVRGLDVVGLVAALILTSGAFFALRSIFISDKHIVHAEEPIHWAELFLMSAEEFFDRRRALLRIGTRLTVAGTLTYVSAILISVGSSRVADLVARIAQ